MITINSPTGKTIHTDLNPGIQQILEKNGIPWYLALQRPINVPENAFRQIDILISQ